MPNPVFLMRTREKYLFLVPLQFLRLKALEQMLFQLLVSIPWKISGFGIRIVALLLFSLLLFALSLFAITLFSLRSLLFRSFALHSFALRSFAVHSFAQNHSHHITEPL